jgi:hypothetical protein
MRASKARQEMDDQWTWADPNRGCFGQQWSRENRRNISQNGNSDEEIRALCYFVDANRVRVFSAYFAIY